MSKQQFIEELFQKRSQFSNADQAEMMANLLETVSSDIYSESQRFVFELIQNADDSAKETDNKVHFEFYPDCLIVSHNGNAFTENDISALTGAGSSTKKTDPTKTGYKGIGFKSVFGKSQRVSVFSDGYQFRFDKSFFQERLPWQSIPIWTEISDLPKSIRMDSGERIYQVSTIIELKKTEGLFKDLNELLDNGQILLFLRRISKISVSKFGEPAYDIEKKITSQGNAFNEIILLKNGKEISSWIVKTFEKIPLSNETRMELQRDEKTPEKLKGAEFTEISFAAKVEQGSLKALRQDESLVFTYLPTKCNDFKFPFLVNGSFLTNAAREGLHEDRVWNQWLLTLTAAKMISWLEILATTSFRFQLLNLLPAKFGNSSNQLQTSFNESLEKSINEKAFVPSKSLGLKKSGEMVIDKTGLTDLSFIAPEAVVRFINQKEQTNFGVDSFVHPQLQRSDKLRSFGTKVFDIDNLEAFFLSPVFRLSHQPSENFRLIEYFFEKATKDDSREWNEKLKQIPFIYAEGKVLKSPQGICFPSIAFQTEFGDGISVIDMTVYQKIEGNSNIRIWLESLGVKEPSDTAYLENEIIGNIETVINKENYLRITRFLLNQHRKAALSEWHYNQLQNLRLFSTSGEFIPGKQCYLSDVYEPILKLERINQAGKYVTGDYKQNGELVSEWKTFFLKIGVSENISVISITTDINESEGSLEPEYFEQIAAKAKIGHSYPSLVTSSNRVRLDKIRFSEFAASHAFAKVFWQQAVSTIHPDSISQSAYMPWGYYGSKVIVQNYFFWSLYHSSVFPTTTKECLKAENVFINDKEISDIAGKYLPVFDYDRPLPDEWKKALPFKLNLQLEDYLTVLSKLAEQTEEDGALRKYNRRRIGSIYNKLAASLPDFPEEKKETIRIWSETNRLLSENETFETAAQLKWIKIDGFRQRPII